jgi:hypothetical protein
MIRPEALIFNFALCYGAQRRSPDKTNSGHTRDLITAGFFVALARVHNLACMFLLALSLSTVINEKN